MWASGEESGEPAAVVGADDLPAESLALEQGDVQQDAGVVHAGVVPAVLGAVEAILRGVATEALWEAR